MGRAWTEDEAGRDVCGCWMPVVLRFCRWQVMHSSAFGTTDSLVLVTFSRQTFLVHALQQICVQPGVAVSPLAQVATAWHSRLPRDDADSGRFENGTNTTGTIFCHQLTASQGFDCVVKAMGVLFPTFPGER